MKINYWRIIEPLALGATANILINYLFNPGNPDFVFTEFVVAVSIALIITEINRRIDILLEKKYRWTECFTKRFRYHLFYLTVFLLFVLNVLGNIYMWIVGDSFHTLHEMLIINLCVLVLALLLTTQKWAIQFYQNWKTTEYQLNNSTQELNKLKTEINKSSAQVELIRGSNCYKINVGEIRYAQIENGIVWVYYGEKDVALFNGTLSSLKGILPAYSFFQVTRNMILHRDSVLAVASSTYGKIDIRLKEDIPGEKAITVSRLKASQFRKWYSSSPVN